ncbi:MAG: tetratricopeptide repeat protein, partial [Spirulina sp.]
MGHRAKWIGWVALAAVLLPVGELRGYAATRQPQQMATMAQGQTAEARLAEADRLFNEALQLWRTSQFESAFNALLQALEIYRHPDVQTAFPDESRQSEGVTLNDLGTISHAFGRYEQALRYFTDALAILQEVGDRA